MALYTWAATLLLLAACSHDALATRDRNSAFLAASGLQTADADSDMLRNRLVSGLMSVKLDDTVFTLRPRETSIRENGWTAIIIRAIVFAIFGSVAQVILLVSYRLRADAELMNGTGTEESTATITAKKHIKKDRLNAKELYEVNYWFEAVRDDGMRCRVEIEHRQLPFSLWRKLEEDEELDVLYFPEDPEHCRLVDAAEDDAERSHGRRFQFQMIGAAVLMVVSIIFGVLLSTFLTGKFSVFIVAALIWLAANTICFLFYFKVIRPVVSPNRSGSHVEELGKQEPSTALGDLSGTWVVETPSGRLEFRFAQVPGAREEIAVKGRRVEEWSTEVPGHFLGERKMTWEQEDGMKFVVEFDGQRRFEGTGNNSKSGETLEVQGLRAEVAGVMSYGSADAPQRRRTMLF